MGQARRRCGERRLRCGGGLPSCRRRYFPQYLWKLFIDERYQGRGYGTATLDLIADYFRRRPDVEIMRTSCGQGDGSPLEFYERYGFEQTGEIVFDDEILLQYKLR